MAIKRFVKCMPDSILEASRKARTRGFGFVKRKSFIALILLVAAGAAYWHYAQSKRNVDISDAVEVKETAVKKGDIKISTETDGKVVAKDGADLSFSISADTLEVTDVYVKEGQSIKKGDKIAKVKADDLEMNVRTSYASYLSTLASYNEKLEGMTEDEADDAKNAIKQAELNLAQSEDNLARTKANGDKSIDAAEDKVTIAKDNLSNDFKSDYQKAIDKAYADIYSNIKSVSISLDDLLNDADEIIGVDEETINDAFEGYLGAKDVGTVSTAELSYLASKNAYQSLENSVSALSAKDFANMEKTAKEAVEALAVFEKHYRDLQFLLASTITGPALSQSGLNAYVATVNSGRTGINSKISALDNLMDALDTAEENLADYAEDYDEIQSDLQKAYEDAQKDLADTKEDVQRDIKDAERNIESKELALAEAKRKYEDLKKPLSEAELASAKSQLTSAAVSLERARKDLEEAVLKSPIDGVISSLAYKAGDTILKDSAKTFVSIVNNDTLFVEVNIEEAEISKIKMGQKAFATFDALDNMEIEGEISFISMTSETNNNGIVTYLVRVLFENSSDSIREGMTAGVEFLTAGVSEVLYVPVDAVRNVSGRPSVQLASGEWAAVTTGFTDGDDVEIISGLSEGQKVVY